MPLIKAFSGTTLVEQIISSHPQVYGADELNFFNDFIKNFFYKEGNFSIEHIKQNNAKNNALRGRNFILKIAISTNKKAS